MGRRLFIRASNLLRQFVCGLHGHDTFLNYEKSRLSMRCITCGYETPGWDLKAAPRPGTESKPRVLRLPLVGHRRVA